ncbi:hypothetical protein [Calidifontibacter terrae]
MTEQPPRRHRRVVRPATGGEPGPEPRPLDEDDEPVVRPPAQERAADQWWQDQRPPHWE